MRRALLFVVLSSLLPACGGGGDPAGDTANSNRFTGVWRGSASSTATATYDLTFVVTTSGSTASGFFLESKSLLPTVKGTLSGTVRGQALDFSMVYPSCTGTTTGTATLAAGPLLNVTFSSNTSCHAGIVTAAANLGWARPQVRWCVTAFTLSGTSQCSLQLLNAASSDWTATVSTVTGPSSGPRVSYQGVTVFQDSQPGCSLACTQNVIFTRPASSTGTWVFRADYPQADAIYSATVAVTVN